MSEKITNICFIMVALCALVLGRAIGESQTKDRYEALIAKEHAARMTEVNRLTGEMLHAIEMRHAAEEKLRSANGSVDELTDRLLDASERCALPEASAPSEASLRAENARLRKILRENAEALAECHSRFGACSADYDAVVKLYTEAEGKLN